MATNTVTVTEDDYQSDPAACHRRFADSPVRSCTETATQWHYCTVHSDSAARERAGSDKASRTVTQQCSAANH